MIQLNQTNERREKFIREELEAGMLDVQLENELPLPSSGFGQYP